MGQLHNDTNLTAAELVEEVPYYVVRLLAGARVLDKWTSEDVREIASGQDVYLLRESSYQKIRAVADEVATLIKLTGIYQPWNIESINRIHKQAAWVAKSSMRIPPHKLRVVFAVPDETNGCTFYREVQPQSWLEKLGDLTPIHSDLSNYYKIGMALGDNFDAIVMSRPSNNMAKLARDFIACGKIVIYETDDLLTDMPDFNPARMYINPSDWYTALIQRAHGRIVSTEQLAEALTVTANTYVVHNGIDPNVWPMRVPVQPESGKPVRIMWAGGCTHSGDLRIIVDPMRRIIKRYGSKVVFIFVGYLPEEFQDRTNSQCVAPAWQRHVQYAPPCTIWQWPGYLAKAGCHIALAPLVKHPFNESKSELKVLEAWALGMPIICSKVAPFLRAVTDGVDGYVVGDDVSEWEARLETLVLSPQKRLQMGMAGLVSLKSKGYLMPDNVLNMELALLKICRGNVGRPECEEAMAKRLQEIGG
jgi:glycosyltransferase involved in cell wall biosynthesis